MKDDLGAIIRKLRRDMSRNAAVLAVCDAAEVALQRSVTTKAVALQDVALQDVALHAPGCPRCERIKMQTLARVRRHRSRHAGR